MWQLINDETSEFLNPSKLQTLFFYPLAHDEFQLKEPILADTDLNTM